MERGFKRVVALFYLSSPSPRGRGVHPEWFTLKRTEGFSLKGIQGFTLKGSP